MEKRRPSDSTVETRYLVLNKDINAHGTVFGGTILAWIDMAASMAAERHAGSQVVTAAMDSVSFHTPINLDDQVALRAFISFVHKSSMEVIVEVYKENPHKKEACLATKAFVTMVALGEDKRPSQAPELLLETEHEKQLFEQGRLRHEQRVKQRK